MSLAGPSGSSKALDAWGGSSFEERFQFLPALEKRNPRCGKLHFPRCSRSRGTPVTRTYDRVSLSTANLHAAGACLAKWRQFLPPRPPQPKIQAALYVISLMLAGFQPTSWQVFSQLWISLRMFFILYRMFPHFLPALALTSFYPYYLPTRHPPRYPANPPFIRIIFPSHEGQASSPLKSQYSPSTGVIRVKEKAAISTASQSLDKSAPAGT